MSQQFLILFICLFGILQIQNTNSFIQKNNHIHQNNANQYILSPQQQPQRNHNNIFKLNRSIQQYESNIILYNSNKVNVIDNYNEINNIHNDDIITIQILMSDTGGGHRASANALRDAFTILYPNIQIQCDIIDIYTEYCKPIWPYNNYVEIYKFLAKYSILWKIFYEFGSTSFGLLVNDFFLNLLCYKYFKNCLIKKQNNTNKRADIIISVHPLTQDLPLKILAELDNEDNNNDKKTPFVTVVTDLGSAHPTWFNPNVDKCFVPSNELYNCAKQRGLQSKQIIQHGLPIRKGFWNDYNNNNINNNSKKSSTSTTVEKIQLRKELGIQIDLPTVLVVGGGDGMGGLVDISKQLGTELGCNNNNGNDNNNDKVYQMVVVCGNNKEAKNSLLQHNWPKNVNVIIQGFVSNMDEWMKASDALVTKAGPGTIAEASICGLPCMMFSFLPGQEEGNIPFVENAGFGLYNTNPNEIARIVCSWLESPTKLELLQQNAINASRPNATLDIAKDIIELVYTKKKQYTNNQLNQKQQQNLPSPLYFLS